MTMRPPEIWSSRPISWAVAAGEREKQLRMVGPSLIFSVFAARSVSQGSTDVPQASPLPANS